MKTETEIRTEKDQEELDQKMEEVLARMYKLAAVFKAIPDVCLYIGKESKHNCADMWEMIEKVEAISLMAHKEMEDTILQLAAI